VSADLARGIDDNRQISSYIRFNDA
jgi:hypothetical protein